MRSTTHLAAACMTAPRQPPNEPLTEAARELAVAAERLHAACGSAGAPDENPYSAMARVVEALGHLGAGAADLARQLESRGPMAVHPSSDGRVRPDLERRMHELVSSLSHARYSAQLAGRELPGTPESVPPPLERPRHSGR